MARRGRKRRRSLKFNIHRDVSYSVIALLFLFLSAISFISFFAPLASVNSIIQQIFDELFGVTSPLVPFFLAYLGLLFLRTLRLKVLNTRLLVGFLGIFFSLSGFLNESAGLTGMKIKALGVKAFGNIGSFVLFFILLIISVLIALNISLDLILSRIAKTLFLEKLKWFFSNLHLKKNKEELNLKKAEESSNEETTSQESKHDFAIVPNLSEPVTETGKTSTSSTTATPSKIPFSDRVWEYPPLDILSDTPPVDADRGNVKERAQIIEKTLDSFGIRARVVEINKGPSVTQYALETAKGTKIARITNLSNDLALALASPNGMVRIEAPIPGRSLIGVEVPNFSPSLVTLKSVLASDIMKKAKSKLVVSLGHTVAGKPYIADIGRMPHVLIAGSTGSGKSVLLNSFISTLLFRCSPNECKFILIDPKRVEFSRYNGIPHLLTPVIVEAEKAVPALKWTIAEMERRYKLFENAQVRDINSYNELSGFQALPYIIIVIDELADIMSAAKVDVEKSICRLAQKSRATGIHLIMATQRPSVDVLTGLIKANIPCRIAFNVTSQVDSRVIIDMAGAEKLLGRGDMLYVPPDVSKPIRIQGVFISDAETEKLTRFLRKSNIAPEYIKDVTIYSQSKDKLEGKPQDELFREAVEIICQYGKASSSLLQRRLSIGYARAARLLDELEERGIVGPQEASKAREVLIKDPSEIFGDKS